MRSCEGLAGRVLPIDEAWTLERATASCVAPAPALGRLGAAGLARSFGLVTMAHAIRRG